MPYITGPKGFAVPAAVITDVPDQPDNRAAILYNGLAQK